MFERIARPFAGLSEWIARLANGIYRILGRPGKLLQDLLNGSWLGHSLHPLLTDVVVGGATSATLLLVLGWFGVSGLEVAIGWALGLTCLAALGAIAAGLTDFKDTNEGDERNVAGLHALINLVATAGLVIAFFARLTGADALTAIALVAGYLVLTVGAFIGGHLVFKYGVMVNYNAFARGKRAAEFTAVLPAAELSDATPTRATLGATALVLVRRGDVVYALKDSCSHAGGRLSDGRLEGDTIVCPLHASAFRLADGAVRHGPAASRQVSYAARLHDGQVEVQGPRD
jgi:nitrite reductase/ring-hydroxylating ferredoxin subunit